jgi:hypothetical protein
MALVIGRIVGGGLAAAGLYDVRFEQGGQLVASTTTVSARFEIRLLPGSYDVIVTNMPGGCPRTPITVQGPGTELTILCNSIS